MSTPPHNAPASRSGYTIFFSFRNELTAETCMKYLKRVDAENFIEARIKSGSDAEWPVDVELDMFLPIDPALKEKKHDVLTNRVHRRRGKWTGRETTVFTGDGSEIVS